MTQLEGVLLLIGLSGGMLLAGYWLAALTTPETTAAERLAVALLAGLGSLLLFVSAVNFFRPLALPWALLCLLPVLLSLLSGPCRRSLWADILTFCRDPETRLTGALVGISLVLLLSGLLIDGRAVFYDASPNHDSYFWITNAEHLKRNTYLVPATATATQPMFDATNAMIGMQPLWGRMGTEGLLALVSSLVGASPLKIYLYGTAALFLAWVAAVYLTAKTFFREKLSRIALASLALFQPLFVFYHTNSNLPNLLGILVGAGAVIATERALRAPLKPAAPFLAWCGLLVLSLHGLCCAYPEMIPFVGLSCGLLWLRPWFMLPAGAAWRNGLMVAAAALLGFAVNPASTVRAWHGFQSVLSLARTSNGYANMFELLDWSEWLPGFLTLAIPAADRLGPWLGAPLSLVLLCGVGLAAWRARDRFGTLAIFAGSISFALYTLATGFPYGWQKTIQFGGVFFAALTPVMTLDGLAQAGLGSRWLRRLAVAAAAVIALFFGYAACMNWRDAYSWSRQKRISTDWFALRELSRGPLRDAPVLVEPATFRMSFFHGMWAVYFLPESRLYFASRGEANGGYVHNLVINERDHPVPPPAAYLVSRLWADRLDANSPRLLDGREFSLLQKCNRVFDLQGVFSTNGPPTFASDLVRLEILPHSPANLVINLAPRPSLVIPSGTWKVARRTPGATDFTAEVAGPPLRSLKVPLTAGQRNEVVLQYEHAGAPLEIGTFIFDELRIEDAP